MRLLQNTDRPNRDRPHSGGTRLRTVSFLLLLICLLLPAAAQAENSPAITLAVSSPSQILIGANATISLEAANASSQPYGYNLSFRAVLPKGVTLVAGSSQLGSGGAAPTPTVIANEPASGETTLIWSNVGDLSPGSHSTLSFTVTPSTSTYPVAGSFKVEGGAYVASHARYLPKFSATGAPVGPSAESFTGSATAAATTSVTAITISQSEGSPEGEILRGVHDHQTVYKITVTNNTVNPTTKVSLQDWLPAALEYLGCGGAGADHTTEAPSNPGSSEEYPGSGPIEVESLAGCKAPELVETAEVDPDGTGEDPKAVYTHVKWNVGTLAAGESRTYEFRAAVPLRENTLKWTHAQPSGASGNQAANLDNNSGNETRDGESLITFAEATGLYEGKTEVSASDHLTRVAKDITTEKADSTKVLADGEITEWTIAVHSSEYRYNTAVEVKDTVPNGLCPLSSNNLTSSAECEPDRAPSSPYTTSVEEANGTWVLSWNETTDAALANLQQNTTTTITYFTRTRTHYQSNHEPALPILANDSIVNTVIASSTTNVVCAGDTDCGGEAKTAIYHQRPVSEAISDNSSASQSAEGPSIAKTVAASGTNCLTDKYVTSTPVYHPGDLVCWRLEATFPDTLSTHGTAITDFLPVSALFDEAFNSGRGEQATENDTLPATTFEHSEAGKTPGGTIKWTLPESGFVNDESQRFQRVYASTAELPTGAAPGDLAGNLMKFASVNSPGESFALRAEANYELQFPELSLAKSIVAIAGKAIAPTGSATVKASQEAEFALAVANAGEQEAIKTEVWDELPAGVECSEISAITAGGKCSEGLISWGNTGLGESAVSVPAKGTTTLHFITKVPAGINPGTTLEDHAGVVEYHGATNTGGEFTYVPAEDIDATIGLEPNVPAANAHALLQTEELKFEKTHTSAVAETGNSSTQATIGELVTFEISVTIPAGTSLGGEARITDPTIPTERLTYEKGSAEALVNGSAAGAEFKVEAGTSPVLVMPKNLAAGEAAKKVTLRFKTHVANFKENNAAGSTTEKAIPNKGELAWTNPITGAQAKEAKDSVPVVEPSIKLAQGNNTGGKPVHGGQLVEYTIEPSDVSGASSAFNSIVVDTVSANVTPANSKGEALANGQSTASGGVWNEAARTITWEVAKIEPGAHSTLAFFVTINEHPVSSTSLTNKAAVTTTSIEGASSFERTAANATADEARYEAASKAALEVEGASLTKESDSPTATIGHRITYTLTVTLPADVTAYDETVIDTLPDSLDFDQYAGSECTAGCPPETAPEVNEYTPVIEATGTEVAWDLGNLSSTAVARTIKIHYIASVRSTHRSGGAKIEAPATIENSARLYYNRSEKTGFEAGKLPSTGSFDVAGTAVAAKTTVVEPKLTLTKELSVDGGAYSTAHASLTDGDTLSYRLTVSNTGTSPAYGMVVLDKPPAPLLEITPTENSGDVTRNVAGEIAWKIPGPLAAGASIKLLYTAKLAPVTSLEPGETVDNEASLPAYFGASESERSEKLLNYAKEAIVYREYAGGTAQVTAAVVLPAVTLEKTTGGEGFPHSANAEANQPFTWRIVIKNTSTVRAKSLDLTDQLPANWEYVAKSASFSLGGSVEPAESGTLAAGRTLTWQPKIELEGGQSTILTYQGRPTVEAERSPGSGEHNANVNTAGVTFDDAAGNPADKAGPFAAGPATAQAVLVIPNLEVSKKAAREKINAGEADSYVITVHNSGAGAAREVIATDTLPTGMTYTPKTATASPSTGFSEQSASSNAASWKVEKLAAGATVKITVPVATAPSIAGGTTLTNKVAVDSVEEPEAVEATGAVEFTTSADLEAKKKIVSGAVAVPGTDMTYEVGAKNNGPSVARTVRLVDHLPSGVEFVSAQSGCSNSAGTVTCSAAEVAVGESVGFTIVVALSPSLTGTVENSVEVKSATTDPEPLNNTATVKAATHPTAELKLTKTALTPEVLDGEEARFALTADNAGPSDAEETEVVDTLPSGMTYKSATGASCKAAKQIVTCMLGTLDTETEATVEVTVLTAGAGTDVNTATVSSAAKDEEPANNTAEASVKVLPVAKLKLEKIAEAAVVKLPGQETYKLVVHNEGPDAASSLKVTDTLPSSETYVSDDAGCEHTGATVTCTRSELADGASWTIHLVTALAANAGKGKVVNKATLSSPTHDPSEAGLAAEATIRTEPVAGLSLEKVALTPEVLDGQEARFELTATNNGPSEADETEIVDTLPAGMTYISASGGSCAAIGQLVTCQLGTLADLAHASVELTVGTSGPGIDVNHATVSSAAESPEGTNHAAEAQVKVLPAADLQLEKTVTPAALKLPGNATYHLQVGNNGPDAAQSVLITDPLPAGETFVSASAGCTDTGQTVECPLGELADGATAAVEIVAALPADAGNATVVNTAEVSSPTGEVSPLQRHASASLQLVPVADLALTKTALTPEVHSGQEARFALTATDNGPSEAAEAKIVDTLPSGMTFKSTSSTAAGVACSAAGQVVTCQLGTLRVGAPVTVDLDVTTGAAATYVNHATLSSAAEDPEPLNNDAQASVTVAPVVSAATRVTLRKLASTGSAGQGAQIKYRLIVRDSGGTVARHLVVCDLLPTDTTVISRGGGHLANGKLCFALGQLAPGAHHTFRLVLRVDSTAVGRIVNHAVAMGANFPQVRAHVSTAVRGGVDDLRERGVTG